MVFLTVYSLKIPALKYTGSPPLFLTTADARRYTPMMKLFSQDPYTHIIDFIDAAVDSRQISAWLAALENEPDNMRCIRLAEIKNRMEYSQAPEQHVELIELMNNLNILKAMNNVIRDVHQSGLNTKNFLGKKDNPNYNLLITLIAATHE